MKLKNLAITSPTALDFTLEVTAPICLLHGKHSALALDLVRELIGDYGAQTDPDRCDDGRFVIHSDIEMEGKNYSVCYIRNADFMGDKRIAANFVPHTLAFSKDDTQEFIDGCAARNKDASNVICNHTVFRITEDDRPLFVYCEDADDISHVLEFLSTLNRQAFVALASSKVVAQSGHIQTLFVG